MDKKGIDDCNTKPCPCRKESNTSVTLLDNQKQARISNLNEFARDFGLLLQKK